MTVLLNFYCTHTHINNCPYSFLHNGSAAAVTSNNQDAALALMLLLASLSGGEITSCPNTSATADTKPLYLLTLASIPDGLTALSGVCIAHKSLSTPSHINPGILYVSLLVDVGMLHALSPKYIFLYTL